MTTRTYLRIGIGALAAIALSAAQQPKTEAQFTRLVHTSKTAESLQTRAVKLVPADGIGPVVWLVSTVHIGEKSYYQTIQKLLDAQDLVLYEGVKQLVPANTKDSSAFPAKQRSTYRLFADSVGLDFQLFDIDYSKKSFRNSDLTWTEVSALSAKEGKATEKQIAGIGKLLDADSPQAGMFKTFLQQVKSDPGTQVAMRVLLAEALSRPDALIGMLGESTSDVLIKKRNAKVLSDLGAEKTARSVAIYFGAAHMPDMERRLLADGRYKEADEQWMPAIEADESKVSPAGAAVLSGFRQMLAPKKA